LLNTLDPKGEEVKAKTEKHCTRARVRVHYYIRITPPLRSISFVLPTEHLLSAMSRFGGQNGFLDGVHFHTPTFNNNGTPYAK